MTDDQRRRLAAKGRRLGRRVLRQVATIVTPDTILRWHWQLIARKWTFTPKRPGRPGIMQAIWSLILRMATENPGWGYTRIQGALKNLGHGVARSTVAKVLKHNGIPPAPGRPTSWRTFLRAHWGATAGADFFTSEVWTPRSGIRGRRGDDRPGRDTDLEGVGQVIAVGAIIDACNPQRVGEARVRKRRESNENAKPNQGPVPSPAHFERQPGPARRPTQARTPPPTTGVVNEGVEKLSGNLSQGHRCPLPPRRPDVGRGSGAALGANHGVVKRVASQPRRGPEDGAQVTRLPKSHRFQLTTDGFVPHIGAVERDPGANARCVMQRAAVGRRSTARKVDGLKAYLKAARADVESESK